MPLDHIGYSIEQADLIEQVTQTKFYLLQLSCEWLSMKVKDGSYLNGKSLLESPLPSCERGLKL